MIKFTYKGVSFVEPPRTRPSVAADRGKARVLRLPVVPLVGEADGDDVGPRLHGPGEAEERDVVGGVPVGAEVVLVLDCFLNWYLQMEVVLISQSWFMGIMAQHICSICSKIFFQIFSHPLQLDGNLRLSPNNVSLYL